MYKSALQRYADNKGITKYSFITSSDELYQSFMQSRQDLAYSLRKEVKRDRYISNAQGIKKDISEFIDKTLTQYEQQLVNTVATDIAATAESMLDNAVMGTTVKGGTSNIGAAMGKILGTAISEGIIDILHVDDWNA